MTIHHNNEMHVSVKVGSDVEFRSETMYMVVLDRFASGGNSTGHENDEMSDPSRSDWNKYWGGNLQGLLEKLPYLRSFGISAVWTTPLFEQVQAMESGENPRAPLHGYWTSDFKRINPRWLNDPTEKRLFTRDDTVFDHLLSEMHALDMKYVLDIVCNHSSPNTTNGKGKLYDDGELIADFDNDQQHWYHHYGEASDWHDKWQLQNCELAGLATFNENNIQFRRYIKEAIKLWISKGVDALRIDTVKHMPIWFWQEFNSDLNTDYPDLFRFGEWMHNHPQDPLSVNFANQSGMSLLDFGFCNAVRQCMCDDQSEGFNLIQAVLDLDGNYNGATELITFFENHDLPRLQSSGVSDKALELTLALLISSRGIPCLYYGCEQYLHNDTDGGNDPYNRPMMESWEHTEATRIIGILAEERKHNAAIMWGGQWPKWLDTQTYVYLRRYRDSRCLVFLNKGPQREITVENLEFPDGEHQCLLTNRTVPVHDSTTTISLGEKEAVVLAVRGKPVEGKTIIRLQVNGAPTQPGCRLVIIGDCPELGEWDLAHAVELECINSNTWFTELVMEQSSGKSIRYKYAVFFPEPDTPPLREPCMVRTRPVVPSGTVKWRDQWEK